MPFRNCFYQLFLRFIIIGLLFSLTTSDRGLASSYHLSEYQDLIEKYKNNLVIVEGNKRIKTQSQGIFRASIINRHIATGFFIDKNTVLTVKGIVKVSETISIRDIRGNTAQVYSYAFHPSLDIALLNIDRDFNVIDIDQTYQGKNSEKCILLSIFDNTLAYQVTDIESTEQSILRFPVKSQFLRAGSMIISENGEIIGIFMGLLKSDQNNKVQRAQHIRMDDVWTGFGYKLDFIKESKTLLLDYDDLNRAQFGIKVYENQKGIIIREIIPESPAHRSGLKPKDIIISINNAPIKNIADIYEAIYIKENPHEKYDFLINRNEDIIKKSIVLKDETLEEDIHFELNGIRFLTLNDQIRSLHGIEDNGYMVLEINPDSKAQGIVKVMDIIIIQNKRELISLFGDIERGISSDLTIMRDGKIRNIIFRRQ